MRHLQLRRSKATLIAVIAALTLLAAACGSDEPDVAGTGSIDAEAEHDETSTDDDHADFAFGEPADPADADRVIEIDATDAFTFEPDQVEVAVGETVTFRVVNVGNLPHDFTIGDAATQDDHEAEMAEMPMGDPDGHDANAMTILAGETAEMTWTFTEAGTILMGCHIPGHYDAGMRGKIAIAAS